MKRSIQISAVVLVIIGLVVLDAWKDYRWAGANVTAYSSEGWVVAASSKNFAAITSPWTLVRTPVSGLWFVKPADALRVTPTIVAIPQMSLHYNFDAAEQFESVRLFDVAKHTSVALEDGSEIAKIGLTNLEWRAPKPGTPDAEVQAFVERLLKRSTGV